jgi:diadenosine tetraphosphatase ApaH/serine/threonine PP2A family protein phosphatase
MLIALLADIHANREALEACLADAAQAGPDRYVFLGDLVGYGADPAWVVDRVTAMAGDGAIIVQGNHDAAAVKDDDDLRDVARKAIDWTRGQLSKAQLDFLAGLPLEVPEEDRLYVHASACAPQSWIYMLGIREAEQCLRATPARVTLCGHTHFPAVFNASPTTPPTQHTPAPGRAIPLLAQRRWIAVLGAVGQPRDNNPDACYGLLDTDRNTITYIRVPYDTTTAARKVRNAGLPPSLAGRLTLGV